MPCTDSNSPDASPPSPTDNSWPPAETSDPDALNPVVIGEKIPYDSADDCPDCVGIVDRYANAFQEAASQQVTIENLTQHTGLTLPMLMDELDTYEAVLSEANDLPSSPATPGISNPSVCNS